VAPKVPTLYTALSAGGNASEATVYGTYTNPFVLKYGDIVDIVLNNDDSGKHPFHLHGHTFQVIYRSDDDEGHWNGSTGVTFPSVPMRRDTLLVHPGGNFVVRFRADNPGKVCSCGSSLAPGPPLTVVQVFGCSIASKHGQNFVSSLTGRFLYLYPSSLCSPTGDRARAG
jgi:hypothetical protein